MTELERLEADLNDPRYRYDTADAEKRINFIEKECKHYEAPWAGKPFLLLLWEKAVIELLYSFKIYDEDLKRWIRRFKELTLLVARKNGKALALDTPINTPDGWKDMKDIHIGDYVFSVDGKPTRVIAESEIFTGHDCYKVTFEDKSEIVADAEHIWTVVTKGSRSANARNCKRFKGWYKSEYRENSGYFDITTEQMANDFYRLRADKKGIEYKYRVPMQKPIEYPEQDLPLNPYALGLWLGDGDADCARINVGADDLEEMMMWMNLYSMYPRPQKLSKGKTCYRVSIGNETGERGKDKNYITPILWDLGLMNNKHIPDIYLRSSVDQRMELLRGLMDTDGTVSKSGECEFSQKDYGFVMQFAELLASLGIKHSITKRDAVCNGKNCEAYRVTFYCDKAHPCFKMTRKYSRLKQNLAPRMLNKSIIGIEKVPSVPTKCIGVEHESHLYLAGRQMTPTHNTPLIGSVILSEFYCGEMGTKVMCSSNDYDQASLMFDGVNAMREESPRLDRTSHKNIKGIFMGNPKQKNARGKFSYQNKGTIRKMSSKGGAKEGRNLKVVVADEVHEMQDNRLIEPLKQAISTQDEPLFIEITTEGFIQDGYLDKRLEMARKILRGEVENDRWLILLYTQDSEEEVWQDEASWAKSNPSLGPVKKYSYLRERLEDAKQQPSTRAFTLAKDFNIKQNATVAWLSLEQIRDEGTFSLEEFRGLPYIGGCDFAETTDLCAAVIMLKKPDEDTTYLYPHYWIPETKADIQLSDGDNALNPEKKDYREWARMGYVTICPGSEVFVADVAEWFYELYKLYHVYPFKVGYDNRFALEFRRRFEDLIGTGVAEQVLQTTVSLSEPMRSMEAELTMHRVQYNQNPVFRWNLENISVETDKDGYIKPKKNFGNPRNRIDGGAAALNCYAMLQRNRAEYLETVKVMAQSRTPEGVAA